jgi:hypothetical protein
MDMRTLFVSLSYALLLTALLTQCSNTNTGSDPSATASSSSGQSSSGQSSSGAVPEPTGTTPNPNPRDAELEAQAADAQTDAKAAKRIKTVCTTGAFSRADNPEFNAICDYPEIASTVVQSCAGGACFNTFETFLVDANTIYAKLFSALDENHDGKYDDKDPACEVNLLGFSWGGVAAVQIAGALLADAKVAPSRRKVHRVVSLDPYQPVLAGLQVPAGIDQFLSFRHSVSPQVDCSNDSALGPYKGLTPHCATSASCTDYDYSLAPNVEFPLLAGRTIKGSEVGHCDVPDLAHPILRALYQGQPLPANALPPTVPVTP